MIQLACFPDVAYPSFKGRELLNIIYTFKVVDLKIICPPTVLFFLCTAVFCAV